MKMRIFTFFSRICTVPGGSQYGSLTHSGPTRFRARRARKIGARVVTPLNRIIQARPAPLPLTLQSRVAYLVYPADRAVVFAGIDRSVSTQQFNIEIIGEIVRREGLSELEKWSFFSLLTWRHSLGFQPGEHQFVNIFIDVVRTPPEYDQGVPLLGTDSLTIESKGCTPIACPQVVLDDFARYIRPVFDGDHEPNDFGMDEDEIDEADRSADDEEQTQ